MKNSVYILATIIILLSCGEKQEKIIDLDSVIPTSDKYKDDVKLDTLTQDKDTLSIYFDKDLIPELGLNDAKLVPIALNILPDRFTPKRSLKLAIMTEGDSLTFCQWTYKDSLKTMNALFNWLDCFGEKCKSLKYREALNFQREAMLLFVNDTSITYISTGVKNKPEQWQQYLEKYNGIDEWDNVVAQSRGGKALWSSYDKKKKKFIPIEIKQAK